MVEEHKYIGSDEKDEVELGRLRMLENVLDPVTIRHLNGLGVREGWKCLEIGAGAGSIAKWLSDRVGPGGKVVATDIDLRFLRRLFSENLEIRKHDITRDELEGDEYDVVHCRTVLMQLPEPEMALLRMAAAVRPGGWLIIEEWDYGSELSVEDTNPAMAEFSATMRMGINILRQKKIVDPLFGRRVRGLIEGLNFGSVAQEGWTCICKGGDVLARFDAATVGMANKPLLKNGLISPEQSERVLRHFMDPTFSYPGSTMFTAWGRKPSIV